MFYKSKATLTTALTLMINHTDKYQLLSNIQEAFQTVNPKNIEDADVRNLFEVCKSIADALIDKGIRTPDQAKIYFENSKLDEDIKSLVIDGNRFTKEVIDEYIQYFARMKHVNDFSKAFNKLEETWYEYQSVGVSDIKGSTNNLLDSMDNIKKISDELYKDTTSRTAFTFSPNNEAPSFGIRELEEDIAGTETSRMKTGMWMDHVTGGGFRGKSLYIIASISGGFKTGFMMNMAEYMSIANDPKQFKLPTGYYPAILHINLELYSTQILEKRMNWYDIDSNLAFSDNLTIEKTMIEGLRSFGSKINVIYQKEKQREYSAQRLKADIKKYEKDGFIIVALCVDYSDLIRYVPNDTDELEGIRPLVRKNEELRSIADEYNIPVITGIQLNRASSELKKRQQRAHKEDLLKYISSENIAKAFDVLNVPEQMYFSYKVETSKGDHYFSLVVEKDRDNQARFIDKDGKHRPPMLGRIHYTARMEGLTNFRIGNDYEDSITKYDTGDDSILTTIELTDEELAELDED